jgi:hypothetical protein
MWNAWHSRQHNVLESQHKSFIVTVSSPGVIHVPISCTWWNRPSKKVWTETVCPSCMNFCARTRLRDWRRRRTEISSQDTLFPLRHSDVVQVRPFTVTLIFITMRSVVRSTLLTWSNEGEYGGQRDMINSFKMVVEKYEGKSLLGRRRYRYENNVKNYLK